MGEWLKKCLLDYLLVKILPVSFALPPILASVFNYAARGFSEGDIITRQQCTDSPSVQLNSVLEIIDAVTKHALQKSRS